MNQLLEEMFNSRTVQTSDGRTFPFHSGVSLEQAAALQHITASEDIGTSLEIGLAYGTSALAIIEGKQARASVSEHRHIALDPHQSSSWNDIGVSNIRRAGFEDSFRFLEEYDYLALPRLVEQGTKLDFAFIDGLHTFDSTLVDAFYIDMMLRIGGILVFHDYTMPGVNRAVRWLQTHRSYAPCYDYEIVRNRQRRFAAFGVRLARDRFSPWKGANAALARSSMPVLRKTGESDSNDWSYYRHF